MEGAKLNIKDGVDHKKIYDEINKGNHAAVAKALLTGKGGNAAAKLMGGSIDTLLDATKNIGKLMKHKIILI